MIERYSRNYLYINSDQQSRVANTTLLFGGAGIGSVIAEAALRLGFRNMIVYDGDEVELSNLNRQNYLHDDIQYAKVERLQRRLIAIDPSVNISYQKVFLTEDNVKEYIQKADIAINAIDYNTDAPFMFDRVCMEQNLPVIHPFNFGWAGCAYVVMPDGQQFSSIQNKNEAFEVTLARHTLEYLKNKTGQSYGWLYDTISEFNAHSDVPPPQLSVGSWITAGLVTHALFCLVNDIPVKIFPEPYVLSARD